jgi:hypothetical protein
MKVRWKIVLPESLGAFSIALLPVGDIGKATQVC